MVACVSRGISSICSSWEILYQRRFPNRFMHWSPRFSPQHTNGLICSGWYADTTLFNIACAVLTASWSGEIKHCITPLSASLSIHESSVVQAWHAWCSSCLLKFLCGSFDSKSSSRFVSFFCVCVQPSHCRSFVMFYFRQAESCFLGLITHHFCAVAVSGSPLSLQQAHKEVGRVHLEQAGQVKHECNCFQMWHRSVVWGVCVCVLKPTHQKVPTSCINLVSAASHSSVPWIIS